LYIIKTPLELSKLPTPDVDATARHHDMHVRMQIQPAVVGMQHRTLAHLRFELACTEAFQGARCGGKQRRIHGPGLGARQRSQLRR